MNDLDNQRMRNRLRELAAAPLGLHIETPEHWAIEGIKDPRRFLKHLTILMEPNAVLYLEGTVIHPEAATLYARHETKHPTPVACGTVFPIPDSYHLDFSSEVVAGMLQLVARRAIGELFTHISGYHCGRLIFSFHDAFEGALLVSNHVAEPIIGAFCQGLDASYSLELTPKQTNPYRDLLYILDHPEKLKIPSTPWWRDFLNGFLSGFKDR